MKPWQKAIITIETHQVTVVRWRPCPIRTWCAACAAEVEILLPDQADELANVSPREIYRRVENQTLHFRETDDGLLLICRSSLG